MTAISGAACILRRTLFVRHPGLDTASLDDLEALRLFQRIADDNRLSSESGDADWQGEAFTLAPPSYAVA